MSKETKNTDTNPNPNAKAAPDSGKQIVQALDTIVHAILGEELQSIRQSITEQDSSVLERIETVRKEVGETLANLKSEGHRAASENRLKISESEEAQQKSLLELGDRTDKWIEGVKKDMQAATRAVDERIQAAKSSMSDNLATQAKKLEDRIETVSRTLVTLQQEVRQQQENSQRVAGVLNNLGAVFQAAPAGAPSAKAQAPPAAVPESKRDSAGPAKVATGKSADLDKALDDAFGGGPKG